MIFDKSLEYSSLNADSLETGDKVIVADCLADLKIFVEADAEPDVVIYIANKSYRGRILVKGKQKDNKLFNLAYHIERKENCTNCGNRGNFYCSCFTRDKSDDELSRTVCGNYIRLSEQKAEKLTIDEAITHCRENNCEGACKAEHEQLADWLEELKAIKQKKYADLRIGQEIYIRANVSEIRKDYIICENAGGYFGTVREEIRCGVEE